MNEHIEPYMLSLSRKVKAKVERVMGNKRASEAAAKAFTFHFNDARSLKFQSYYAETVGNPQSFLTSQNFFNKFKSQYSLQGIDGKYLARLESQKRELLCLVEDRELQRLYSEHFQSASIRHGDAFVNKNLGSFFSKFVHTFIPADYCALDNPIRNHFGLSNESFFVAFLVISHAYREWAADNYAVLKQVRNEIPNTESVQAIASKMTDLKLLDLIFWFKVNGPDA